MGKIHNSRELEKAAKKAGCQVQYGNGRHPKIVTPNGYAVPYPNHPGDLANGTLRSILKLLEAAGIFIGVIAMLYFFFPVVFWATIGQILWPV